MSQAWQVQSRQTGRTTRMLQEAIRLEKEEGRAVYVMAANKIHRDFLEERLIELGGNPNTIKVETPTSLKKFDWDLMRLTGAHWTCDVLVDHFTIESRYAGVLSELHRFDV